MAMAMDGLPEIPLVQLSDRIGEMDKGLYEIQYTNR